MDDARPRRAVTAVLLLQVLAPPAPPAAFADRWVVLGDAHDSMEQAEAQAAAIRRRHYPEAQAIDTDHYEGLPPGLHVVCFAASATRREAYGKTRGIRNLGHRIWARYSGVYVDRPTAEQLRRRRVKLAVEPEQRVVDVVEAGRLLVATVEASEGGGAFDLVVVRPRRFGSDLVARRALGAGPCDAPRPYATAPLHVAVSCGRAVRKFALGPDDVLHARRE